MSCAVLLIYSFPRPLARPSCRGQAAMPISARDRLFEGVNAVWTAGAEKIQRLHEAHLAKELLDKEALKARSMPGLPETF